MRIKIAIATLAAALGLLAACTTTRPRPPAVSLPAPEFWLDLVSGEEVGHDAVIADLATAGVVYVGESHTVARHHDLQFTLLQELFARGRKLVLCMEQLEAADQPAVDRYNRREIDFATLAREIDWPRKWRNHEDYRALCEFAQQHGIPVRALNAPAELIRAISRGGGVARLTAEQRAQLPPDLKLDDTAYERLLDRQLAVHMAADPAKLRPMIEAQMARDEVMGANIVAARRDGPGEPRTAFVVLGAGHIRFGFGTPTAVRRRDASVVDRLVLATESGQVKLTAAEQAASREVTILHADLRAIGRPPADYLRVLPLARHGSGGGPLPPGHPPIQR